MNHVDIKEEIVDQLIEGCSWNKLGFEPKSEKLDESSASGATVEKETEKAHPQKEPSDNAKLKITDQRFIKSNIKLIGEEQDGSKKDQKS